MGWTRGPGKRLGLIVLGLANRSVVFDGSPVNKERLTRKISTLLAEQKEMLENPIQCNSIEDEF